MCCAEVVLKQEVIAETTPRYLVLDAPQRGDNITVQVINGDKIDEVEIKKSDVAHVKCDILKFLGTVDVKDEMRVNIHELTRLFLHNSYYRAYLRHCLGDEANLLEHYKEPEVLQEQKMVSKSKRSAQKKQTAHKRAKRDSEEDEFIDDSYDDEL
jgi:hypothetical protein